MHKPHLLIPAMMRVFITLSTILGCRYSCSMPCTRFCEIPDIYQKAAYQHMFRVCYLWWIGAKP